MRPMVSSTATAREVATTRTPRAASPSRPPKTRSANSTDPAGDARRAGHGAQADREAAMQQAARVRRRRLARVAHPADQRARQPRTASRLNWTKSGKRRARNRHPRCAPRQRMSRWSPTSYSSPAATPASIARGELDRVGRQERGPRSRSPSIGGPHLDGGHCERRRSTATRMTSTASSSTCSTTRSATHPGGRIAVPLASTPRAAAPTSRCRQRPRDPTQDARPGLRASVRSNEGADTTQSSGIGLGSPWSRR